MAKEIKNKKRFLIGLMFIGLSFFCILFIFYFVGSANMEKTEEIDQLSEQLTILEIESSNAQEELAEVKGNLNTIELDRLVQKANTIYDAKEKNRKEGLLWIDREASTYVVTLGAFNGLQPGSRLGVYDGDKRIGQVVVKTPLDIISYVNPINTSFQGATGNNFRVVIE